MRADWEVTDYIWERDGAKTRGDRSGYDEHFEGYLRPRMKGVETQSQCIFSWERQPYLTNAVLYHLANGPCYLMEGDDP